jgi:gas vesicle protein
MNFSQLPILISCVIALIGMIGVVSALVAVRGVLREFKILEKAKGLLEGTEDRSHLHNETSPSNWLKESGIDTDSHAKDQLETVWSGWRAQRIPTLGELHVLASRRERSRSSARISGGIAASLLICGIAGTLWAVHPILSGFKIEMRPDGTVQEASRSAESVLAMIHGLGTAFWPSLAAMVSTLAVVFFRGLYLNKANQLARALDRFACDDLFPLFRLPTLGEQMDEVKKEMFDLALKIDARDKAFATAVGTMKQIVDGIRESAPALAKAAHNLAEASERLSSETNSINDGLARQLGEKSPLIVSLNSVGEMVPIGRQAVSELKAISSTIERRLTSTYSAMLQSGEALKKAADIVPDLIKGSYEEGSAQMAAQLQTLANKLVDEKLGQFQTALKADYEKLSDNIATVSKIAEEIPASTYSAMLRSGEALKKTADIVPDLIKSSYEQGSAQMAVQLQTLANKLVDEKLGQFQTALKADYEKLSDNIAAVGKIAEEIPARIKTERRIFTWFMKGPQTPA